MNKTLILTSYFFRNKGVIVPGKPRATVDLTAESREESLAIFEAAFQPYLVALQRIVSHVHLSDFTVGERHVSLCVDGVRFEFDFDKGSFSTFELYGLDMEEMRGFRVCREAVEDIECYLEFVISQLEEMGLV